MPRKLNLSKPQEFALLFISCTVLLILLIIISYVLMNSLSPKVIEEENNKQVFQQAINILIKNGFSVHLPKNEKMYMDKQQSILELNFQIKLIISQEIHLECLCKLENTTIKQY